MSLIPTTHERRTFQLTEYDVLKQVVLCKPEYMSIIEVINETQKKYKDDGINIELAMEQHKEFAKTLKKHGVDVAFLPTLDKHPEQVFTRDIGFTLGHTIFVAEMANDIRKGEEHLLKEWLIDEGISYFNIVGDMIEGGDVIIDNTTIYIGVSNRTNYDAIEHVRSMLPQFEVVAIPFTETYLHLDCVFNIVSPKEALIYPKALKTKEYELLETRYDLIEVSEEEQFTLGTNVLSIGNKRLLSLPVNKNVNNELRKRGFEVIEVDISEIIKSGGSFRCCSMPVLREESKI